MALTNKIKITTTGDCLTPGSYKLYASFRRIDNFANSAGELIALSDDHSFLAANTIIVNGFSSGQFEHLEIHPDKIIFDNTICSRSGAYGYQSDFAFPDLDYRQIQEVLQSFIENHKPLFPPNSLFFLLEPGEYKAKDSCFEKALVSEFKQAFLLFREHFFESIHSFRARGRGLTPSGDDFIAGILYGTHCLEALKREDFSGVRNKTFDLTIGRNLFSNNLLQMALEARYFKRLKDFLQALFYPGSTEPESAFMQLIATGHTSGADLLAGFFAVVLNQPLIFSGKR